MSITVSYIKSSTHEILLTVLIMENQGNAGTAMIKNFCFTWYDVNKFEALFDKNLDRLGIQYIVMGRNGKGTPAGVL